MAGFGQDGQIAAVDHLQPGCSGAGDQSAKLRMHLRRAAGQIQRADRVCINDVTQQLDQLVRHGLGAGWPGVDVAVQATLVAAVGEIYL